MKKGGKVVAADPAGQLDLYRGEDGLRVNDVFDIPGLGHRGPVSQAHHDALQATGAEGHLDQLTDGHLLSKGRGDGIMKGEAQRAVFVPRAFFFQA